MNENLKNGIEDFENCDTQIAETANFKSENYGKQNAPKVFQFIDGNTLMKRKYEPLKFAVEKILPHGIFIIGGPGKTGKSWYCLDLCVSIATGKKIWDFECEHGDALYLALEDNYPRFAARQKVKATSKEIEAIGKLTVMGNFSVTADELTKLKTIAKNSLTADDRVREAVRKRKEAESGKAAAESKVREYEAKEAAAKRAKPSITEHVNWFDKFIAAMRRAPKRLMATIEDILRKPPEREAHQQRPAQERDTPVHRRSTGIDL